jgi:hypothetical protein
VGYFGNSGAAVLYGPGVNNWDLEVAKLTRLKEPGGTQFRAKFFNACNHAQFHQPNGNANFGHICAPRRPRLIQVSAKLIW